MKTQVTREADPGDSRWMNHCHIEADSAEIDLLWQLFYPLEATGKVALYRPTIDSYLCVKVYDDVTAV